MQKLVFAALFLSLITQNTATAQNMKKSVRDAADLKSGKSQDVLISFFQLGLDDLTGSEKTFKFQSSLFALKAKTDSTIFIDTNYLRQRFARNFVISLATTLDSTFSFHSNTFGVKYAIINNRDKSVFDFILQSEEEWLYIQKHALADYARVLPEGVNSPEYKLARNFFLDEDDGDEKRTLVADLPYRFKKILEDYFRNSQGFQTSTPGEFRNRLDKEYKSLATYVEKRGLWTVDGNFSSDHTGRLFSKLHFNTEYLKGILNNNRKMGLQLNFRSSLTFEDDYRNPERDLQKRTFTFSGGFNWILSRNNQGMSIAELKSAVALNQVIRRKFPEDEKSKIIIESTFRFRLTNDFWLPIEFTYEPAKKNLLFLFGIRMNFDWLGGS